MCLRILVGLTINEVQLGGANADEHGSYILGDDALAVLRDLKRWLKLYDEKTNRLDVARCLAEANLVRGDLLPIIATWKEDGMNEKSKSRIALACLELLVPLTWPLEQEEMTANHHRHTPYILQAQVKYKAAVLHWETTFVLRQAIRLALPALAMKREERTVRDEGIIKLMLYFIRNIAGIRQVPNLPSQGLDNEVSRSTTIEAFRRQDIFTLLLTICSNIGEDFNLEDVVVLETLFNLIKGVSVEKLWMTEVGKKESNISDLKTVLDIEANMHREAKKNAPSRHGRFGTMIWVQQDTSSMKAISGQNNLKDDQTAMFNIDNTKKWNKPLQRRKDLDHSNHDFDREEPLTNAASDMLRNFVEEFLDSGFNPLITHLRKAIEREAERLLPVNYRQFFYIVAWFLKAERIRREQKQKDMKSIKVVPATDPESYALVAAVLNQETFIVLNRYMQMSFDDRAWQDLSSCMRCLTEILLTVQDMSQSTLEEDQEIAENIQNRIFYEESTHDRIISLLKGYKDQGLGYLDACTELAHVFLRLLERYSKENIDLQIRSKRKARRQLKEARQKIQSDQPEAEEDEGEESEHEDVVDVVQVSKERKFDFKRFAVKFVSQASVDTYISLLKFHNDLSCEQLKRVHRFLHRVAFKQEQAILLFRVDIVALLYKLIEGPDGLPKKHKMQNEWAEFTRHLFRKLFKKIDERPELLVEMLFSKVNSTLYYLEHGHDKTVSTIRAPAEIEVKDSATRDRLEQIGIVVTVLVGDDKKALVDWVKTNIGRSLDKRKVPESTLEDRETPGSADEPMQQTTGEAQQVVSMSVLQPISLTVSPSSEDIRFAMFKNARLRLLMQLVGMRQKKDDAFNTMDAIWIIPSEVLTTDLQSSYTAIEQYSFIPWKSNNDDSVPEDMLRRARKPTSGDMLDHENGDDVTEARRNNFIDDSEGDDNPLPEEEEFLFPDNPRKHRDALEMLRDKRKTKKRKRGVDDTAEEDSEDEAACEERRRRRKEAADARRRKFKSEAYIRDSDDETDEESDRLFFAKEAEIRRKQNEKVKLQLAIGGSAAEDMDLNAVERTRKTIERLRGQSEEEEGAIDIDDIETTSKSSQLPQIGHKGSSVVETDREGETPPSSPPEHSFNEDDRIIHDASRYRNPLKELDQSRTARIKNKDGKIVEKASKLKGHSSSEAAIDSDMEDDMHTKMLSGRRNRGGFVIDDDDEE